MDAIRELLSSAPFMPHGHCYLWNPGLVWLEVLANACIAAAYIAISATLAYIVFRIRDLPFKVMYLAFGVFIVACGFTHILDVVVIWEPVYWIDGLVRGVTAVASVATAIALPSLVPKAVALARGAQAAQARGIALDTAMQDLGTMYERTRELEQLKTALVAGVSHELRTPLASILGPTEKLLARGDLTIEQRGDLEVIGRNARTLLRHTNDLLDVSKLEATAVKLTYADVDVASRLRAIVGEFDSVARERQLLFSIDVPERLPGQVDIDQLSRIVLNLLSNAFRFTPRGGAIRLAAQRTARWLRLEIADSGPGIPVEQRTLIFERFRQLDGATKRRFGGTGLGLAIVRDLVRLHGGEVAVTGAPEGGALFVVELPLIAPAGAEVRREPTATLGDSYVREAVADLVMPSAEVPVVTGDRLRVLVVEDNPDLSAFVAAVLAPDYTVEVAADGKQGLDAAIARPPDLIVSDTVMPVLSGDALLAELRTRRELDDVPVMVLSAKADEALRVRLLREGAQDYLVTPFSTEELRARVANLLAVRRARGLLQAALDSKTQDVAELAAELLLQKRALDASLDATSIARSQAERAAQFKSDLLSLVSHELRTPLNALGLQIERLRRERELMSVKQSSLVERAGETVLRLNDLVDSLLQYSRIDQDRLVIEIHAVDLGELAQHVVDELTPQAEQKRLQLRVTAPRDVTCLTDPKLLRLVLVNLVANALKFTEQGHVEVRVEEGPPLRVAVSDTGRGIAESERRRIFEPFEQLELIKNKHTTGVGLGLALVRELTRALGARVELQSEVGRGSTFTVILPILDGADTTRKEP
jgi:signal transduction histidine kinase